jgi:hypothetical protein
MRRLFAGALCAFCVVVPSQAQMIPGLQAMVIEHQFSNMRNGGSTKASKSADPKTTRRVADTARPKSAEPVRSSYLPSPARRRANLARFVEKSRAVDPQGAAALEQLVASTDLIAAFGRALAPLGLRIDDVADAYTVWWVSAWQAAHGDTGTPSRATAQAVRAQAARALAATREFARADDAAKQEYAEALLVQAALIDGMMDVYGSDPTMAPKVAASVRQGARTSGLDLDAMTLTEAGFVPVG